MAGSQISVCCASHIAFRVTGHLETSENDIQCHKAKGTLYILLLPLSHKMQFILLCTGPFRVSTVAPESQMSLRSALLPAVFKLQATFEKRAPHDLYVWSVRLKDQTYPHATTTSESQIHSFLLYNETFSSWTTFADKCTKWPPNGL